jgi:hypothetical protein
MPSLFVPVLHLRLNGRSATNGINYLGDSNGETSSIVALTFSDTVRPVLVSAGAGNSCALFENGGIRCWGENKNALGRVSVGGRGGAARFLVLVLVFFFFCAKNLTF